LVAVVPIEDHELAVGADLQGDELRPGVVGEEEVGLTVTTDDERMRCLFEPGAPQIAARIDALRRLQEAGVRTYVFIGPMLPMNPARLAAMLRGCVGETLVDPMNYAGKTRTLFRRLGEERWLDPAFTVAVADELLERLRGPDPAGA
jgi:DNA repair photolyase